MTDYFRTQKSLLILLAEDDPHTRLTLDLTLRRCGYRTFSAESANTLLTRIQSDPTEVLNQAGLLVTDLNMPGYSGARLIQELDLLGKKLPVVLITAYYSPELAEELNRRGGVTILEKPFTPAALVEAVEKALIERGHEQ